MSSPSDIKQVIVIRKDLNMRKGKMIAQGAHASNMFLFDCFLALEDYEPILRSIQRYDLMNKLLNQWIANGYKKVVVGCDSEEELDSIVKHALDSAILAYRVYDSGLTEFHGTRTLTCASIGPAESDLLSPITGDLKLL